MDYRIWTTDSQSEGLLVIGVGEPWLIYLEGIKECYVLEPLVTQGLSHSVNLGMSFLRRYNLKMICTEEEVPLMPWKDSLAQQGWWTENAIAFSARDREQCYELQRIRWYQHRCEGSSGRSSASMCWLWGWKRPWEFMQWITVWFLLAWGNTFQYRQIVR